MASSSASGTAGQLIKPMEYMNWLALGYALTTELCHGLRPFINREMVNFYQNVNTRLAGSGPCTCVFVPRRRPNQYHDMGTCAWAFVLQGHHHTNKPNWKQSDASKWLDPILGPWEIAKLFLPDLGGHVVIQNAEDMDITGILNLMYFCGHFTIPQHLIKDVRDIKNKWVHVPSLEITNAEIDIAFYAIENLLSDPVFAHDPGIKKVSKKSSRFFRPSHNREASFSSFHRSNSKGDFKSDYTIVDLERRVRKEKTAKKATKTTEDVGESGSFSRPD